MRQVKYELGHGSLDKEEGSYFKKMEQHMQKHMGYIRWVQK